MTLGMAAERTKRPKVKVFENIFDNGRKKCVKRVECRLLNFFASEEALEMKVVERLDCIDAG